MKGHNRCAMVKNGGARGLWKSCSQQYCKVHLARFRKGSRTPASCRSKSYHPLDKRSGMILTPYITTRREAGRGTKGNIRLGRRADSGSVGQGSWVKWVNKSGWVTWVMGQCLSPVNARSVNPRLSQLNFKNSFNNFRY